MIVAFAGVLLGQISGNDVYDGIASILIGIILIAVSVVLVRESRSLLMGEPISKKTLQKITQLTQQDSAVERIIKNYSTYLAPEEVVLQLEIAFKYNLTLKELLKAIERIKAAIQKEFPRIKQLFIEPAVKDKKIAINNVLKS